MSGSSTSNNTITLIGCRMAGPASYSPAHIPVGGQKPIRQMATFSVYQNINGKPSRFRITAWGKMADVVAKSCAPGKELHLICEAHSYQGKIALPTAPGQPLNFVLGNDGQPIMTEKIGFVLRRINFGQDSDKQVQFEIQNGMRPPMWNVAGHADNLAWKNICQQRNATQFVQGNAQFGYAEVRTPNGQIVDPATINNANLNTQGGYNAGTAQAAPNGFQGVQQNMGAPVNVNGQNVGYQPAGQAPAQAAPAGQAPAAGTGTGFAM